jgi:hypothetical protein
MPKARTTSGKCVTGTFGNPAIADSAPWTEKPVPSPLKSTTRARVIPLSGWATLQSGPLRTPTLSRSRCGFRSLARTSRTKCIFLFAFEPANFTA